MVHETKFGGSMLKLLATRGGRFRVELDGERRRVRARRDHHDWIEGAEADLDLLIKCLEDECTKRTEGEGTLVFEQRDFGLSGYDATTTVILTLDAQGVVEVDMHHQVNEGNPHIGW
jgi:hypothetical protein